MAAKQYIITIDEEELTLEFLKELRAHGAEIRAIDPAPEHMEQLDVPPELAERITRDLEAIEAGESEGISLDELKTRMAAWRKLRKAEKMNG